MVVFISIHRKRGGPCWPTRTRQKRLITSRKTLEMFCYRTIAVRVSIARHLCFGLVLAGRVGSVSLICVRARLIFMGSLVLQYQLFCCKGGAACSDVFFFVALFSGAAPRARAASGACLWVPGRRGPSAFRFAVSRCAPKQLHPSVQRGRAHAQRELPPSARPPPMHALFAKS